jgi:hypothetical protein
VGVCVVVVCGVCVNIFTRLWPNRYSVNIFQVVDSPLPKVVSSWMWMRSGDYTLSKLRC